MQDTKLWRVVNGTGSLDIAIVPNAAQTKTEELLEDILVKAPDLLVDGLKLVGRQVETSSGPLDLLGVDEDGQLIVFELKRGMLTRDAVAQVIDYGSFLAELDASALNVLVVEGSGRYGVDKIDDFVSWYEDQFSGKTLELVGRPRMVLVGLGVDDRARCMVEFLASRGVEISLITFHGFVDRQGTYLAKQVEVLQRPAVQSSSFSKQANLQSLERRLNEAGAKELFNKVADVIRSELGDPYEWPNRTGFAYSFPETTDAGTPSNRIYVSLSVGQTRGSIFLSLQPRAIQAAGTDWSEIEKLWNARIVKRKGYLDVTVLSLRDWESIENDFRRLCVAVLHRRKLQQQAVLTEILEKDDPR